MFGSAVDFIMAILSFLFSLVQLYRFANPTGGGVLFLKKHRRNIFGDSHSYEIHLVTKHSLKIL